MGDTGALVEGNIREEGSIEPIDGNHGLTEIYRELLAGAQMWYSRMIALSIMLVKKLRWCVHEYDLGILYAQPKLKIDVSFFE